MSDLKYEVPPAPRDPKPAMIDCTDRPDIIEACKSEAFGAPIGCVHNGRFYAYTHSLREWRGEKIEYIV